jgi:hypothetical protein
LKQTQKSEQEHNTFSLFGLVFKGEDENVEVEGLNM